MKKCLKCSKPATVHITEIEKQTPHEVHLCELHAQQYLSQSEQQPASNTAASVLAQYLAAGTVELAKRDKKTCPTCGMSYQQFRNQQRLGCPNDYEVFRSELVPLLENIHGEATHCGKVPRRAPGDSRRQAELIKLRHELKRAVADEAYEEAARLRDQIHQMEQQPSA